MTTFETTVKNTWGKQGQKWLVSLPSIIKNLAEYWQLKDIKPVDNMTYNYVAKALKNNIPVVLKISCDEKLISEEYHCLQYVNGHGSINVIDINREANALLLEQAIPGNSLKEYNINESIPIYADVVKQWPKNNVDSHQFKPVSYWCKAIDRINDKRVHDQFIKKSKKLRADLLHSAGEKYVCHGDLHADNIIQNQSRWLAIDPKGIIAETAFEVAAFDFISNDELEKNGEAISTLLLERANRLSTLLSIDINRLLSWIFLRLIISAQWFIEGKGDPTNVLLRAEKFYPLLSSENNSKKEQWHADIDITNELAKISIENQFKMIAPLKSIQCIGEGWDNKVFLVNENMIFRFPRRKIAIDLIERENDILTNLQSRFAIDIPNPIYVGKPSSSYPYAFHGYAFIKGISACHAKLTMAERVASIKPLALFLKSLHGITETEAEKIGAKPQLVDRTNTQRLIESLNERMDKIISRKIAPINPSCFAAEMVEAQKIILPKNDNVLVHGDLYCRHLMFYKGKLSGVIDWGDVGINSRSVDLAVMYEFYPPEYHRSFFHIYGDVDSSTLKHARFLSIYGSLTILLYGYDVGDNLLVEEARESLNRINPELFFQDSP